ncbi:MAG TPA: ankyrin repeat domain-containing protein [Armatimonadota bacterium]|nr:ankyrin repeat domain-containing protein [Armatimonadota bacterium]
MVAPPEPHGARSDEWIRCLCSRNAQALVALIEAGCAVDHRPGYARAPLHCAARWGLTEMVEALLAYHASPNRPDNLGRTPLHAAATGGHVPVIARLVLAGAAVNARDSVFGMTPLHCAARHGHAEALWHLLWYGADREHRDAFGDTALTLAYRMRAREVIAYLRAPMPLRPLGTRGAPHRSKP